MRNYGLVHNAHRIEMRGAKRPLPAIKHRTSEDQKLASRDILSEIRKPKWKSVPIMSFSQRKAVNWAGICIAWIGVLFRGAASMPVRFVLFVAALVVLHASNAIWGHTAILPQSRLEPTSTWPPHWEVSRHALHRQLTRLKSILHFLWMIPVRARALGRGHRRRGRLVSLPVKFRPQHSDRAHGDAPWIPVRTARRNGQRFKSGQSDRRQQCDGRAAISAIFGRRRPAFRRADPFLWPRRQKIGLLSIRSATIGTEARCSSV